MEKEILSDARPPADLTLVIRKLILAKVSPFGSLKKIHYHPFRGVWILDFVRANGTLWSRIDDFINVQAFGKVYLKYDKFMIIRLHWEREVDNGKLDHLPIIWGDTLKNFL